MSHKLFEQNSKGEEKEKSVFYVPIEKIRISKYQRNKISADKVEKHKKFLYENEEKDLLPIDVLKMEDGTFIIDGNGRHRFFAYQELGYKMIPVNVKQSYEYNSDKKDK